MAPIHLPAFSKNVELNPEPPSDPTTPEDIVIVSDSWSRVQLPTSPLDPPIDAGVVTAQALLDDLANPSVNKAQIMTTHTKWDEAPPPWFEAAADARVQPMHDRITALETKLAKVSRIAALAHNWNLWIGSEMLVVVDFPNGDDPTAAPHNLPPLRSVKAILELSPADCHSYYQGYCPNAPLGVKLSVLNMAEEIRFAIGGLTYRPLDSPRK